MKKKLALLGIVLTCIFGLTACGNEADAVKPILSEEEAQQVGEQVVISINQIVMAGQQEEYADDYVISAGLDSWTRAQEDMGGYIGILGYETEIDDEEAIITVLVDGSVRDANVEIILDPKYNFTSITTNVIYSFGEMMSKAGLNTLIGMGTVFVVLILISFIISAFNLIPRVQALFSKKNKEAEQKEAAVENTFAQIIEKEEQSDDLELVAVIAAAIAASEGAASADGYVVRSIRRR